MKERQEIWETEYKGFRRDDAFAMSSTRTEANNMTGVINQAAEEDTSSEEEESKDEQ